MIDINQTFGRLTVIAKGERRGNNRLWICKCVCGTVKPIEAISLNSGRTQSCGCLSKEVASGRSTTHGKCRTRAWRAWSAMVERCENPNRPDFRNYGGRGIRVAPEFRNFEGFYAALGECPPGYSLDRIDVNGNYEPGNVRWAPSKIQNRNRRNNRHLTFEGKTLTLVEWSERTGLDRSCISARIEDGWPPEIALTTPSRGKRGGGRIYRPA